MLRMDEPWPADGIIARVTAAIVGSQAEVDEAIGFTRRRSVTETRQDPR